MSDWIDITKKDVFTKKFCRNLQNIKRFVKAQENVESSICNCLNKFEDSIHIKAK